MGESEKRRPAASGDGEERRLAQEARLAAALRENLRKRKAQVRGRQAADARRTGGGEPESEA